MMKYSNLFLLLAVLFISDNALAVTPTCPCDTATLSNGLTGNNIVDINCPNGNLGKDSDFFFDPQTLGVFLINFPHSDYFVEENNVGEKDCVINSDGVEPVTLQINDTEYNNCKERLIKGCSLLTENIPTLSEWGLIAMAGLMGIVGFIVMRKKKVTA